MHWGSKVEIGDFSGFLSLRSAFLWGSLNEKLKILKLHLNHGLKNMGMYVLTLDLLMILNTTSVNPSLIFGALGFLKHWL